MDEDIHFRLRQIMITHLSLNQAKGIIQTGSGDQAAVGTAAVATSVAVTGTIGGSATGVHTTIVAELNAAASAANAVQGHLNDALGSISAAERRLDSEEASLRDELRRRQEAREAAAAAAARRW